MNGGGDGSEWLWAERINTRKPPMTWVSKVPDATECPGGKCSEENKDYCDQRFDDGGKDAKENKKQLRNFDFKTARKVCECGSGKKCDKRCRFLAFKGNYW